MDRDSIIFLHTEGADMVFSTRLYEIFRLSGQPGGTIIIHKSKVWAEADQNSQVRLLLVVKVELNVWGQNLGFKAAHLLSPIKWPNQNTTKGLTISITNKLSPQPNLN